MRNYFVIALLLNLGLNFFSLFILPETVAIHFGLGGRPDRWATRETHAFLMVLVDMIVFLPLYFAPALMDRIPPRFLSLPYKRYWLRDENREEARQMLAGMMSEFGIALFGFLFGATLLAIDANRAIPVRLNERLLLFFLVGFLVYTIVWTIRLVGRLRPPQAF